MKSPSVGVAAALLFASLSAEARDVQSLQPLLLDAMRDGHAEGVLVGPIADTFARLFKTSAPLLFSVKTLGPITPTCNRLEVTASQNGVWDRNSKQVLDHPESRLLVYQVSMCADGSYYQPPRTGATK